MLPMDQHMYQLLYILLNNAELTCDYLCLLSVELNVLQNSIWNMFHHITYLHQLIANEPIMIPTGGTV